MATTRMCAGFAEHKARSATDVTTSNTTDVAQTSRLPASRVMLSEHVPVDQFANHTAISALSRIGLL